MDNRVNHVLIAIVLTQKSPSTLCVNPPRVFFPPTYNNNSIMPRTPLAEISANHVRNTELSLYLRGVIEFAAKTGVL